MQKRYLSKKAVAGAPYIPELRSYLVDQAPNGELLDEVEVYGIELLQPIKDDDSSSDEIARKRQLIYVGIAVVTVCIVLMILTRD